MASKDHVLHLDSKYTTKELTSTNYKLILNQQVDAQNKAQKEVYTTSTKRSKNQFTANENQSWNKKIVSSNPIFIYAILNYLYHKKTTSFKQLQSKQKIQHQQLQQPLSQQKFQFQEYQVKIQNQTYFNLFQGFSKSLIIHQLQDIQKQFEQFQVLKDQFYFQKNGYFNMKKKQKVNSSKYLIQSIDQRRRIVKQMIKEYTSFQKALVIQVVQPIQPMEPIQPMQMQPQLQMKLKSIKKVQQVQKLKKQDEYKQHKKESKTSTSTKNQKVSYFVLYQDDNKKQHICFKLSNFVFRQVAIELHDSADIQEERSLWANQMMEKSSMSMISHGQAEKSVQYQINFNGKIRMQTSKQNDKDRLVKSKKSTGDQQKPSMKKKRNKISKNQNWQKLLQYSSDQQDQPKLSQKKSKSKSESKSEQESLFKHQQLDISLGIGQGQGQGIDSRSNSYFSVEQSIIHFKEEECQQLQENHSNQNQNINLSMNMNNSLSFSKHQQNYSNQAHYSNYLNRLNQSSENYPLQQKLSQKKQIPTYQNMRTIHKSLDSNLFIREKTLLLQKRIRFSASTKKGKVNFSIERLQIQNPQKHRKKKYLRVKQVLFVFGHEQEVQYYYQQYIIGQIRRMRCKKISIFHVYCQNSLWLSIIQNMYKSGVLQYWIKEGFLYIVYDQESQIFMDYLFHQDRKKYQKIFPKLYKYQQAFISLRQFQKIKNCFAQNLKFFSDYVHSKHLYLISTESLDWKLINLRKEMIFKNNYRNVPSQMSCPQKKMILRGDKEEIMKLLKFKVSTQNKNESQAIKQQPKIHNNTSRHSQKRKHQKKLQVKIKLMSDVKITQQNCEQFLASVNRMKIVDFQPLNASLSVNIRLMNYASKQQKIYIVFKEYHELIYLFALIVDGKIQLKNILQLKKQPQLFRKNRLQQFMKDIFLWKIQIQQDWDKFIEYLNVVQQFSKSVIMKNRDFYQILYRRQKLKTVISVCVDFHDFNMLMIENTIKTFTISDTHKSSTRLLNQKRLVQEILNNPEKHMVYEFGQYQIDPISCYNISKLQEQFMKAFKQNQSILQCLKNYNDYCLQSLESIDYQYKKNMYFELLISQKAKSFQKLQIICFPFHKESFFIDQKNQEIDGRIVKRFKLNSTLQKSFLKTPIQQKFFNRYKEEMMKKSINFFYFVLPYESTQQIKIFDYKTIFTKLKKRKLIQYSLSDSVKLSYWKQKITQIKYQIQLKDNHKIKKIFQPEYSFSFADQQFKKFVGELHMPVESKIQKYIDYPGEKAMKLSKQQEKLKKFGIKANKSDWLQIIQNVQGKMKLKLKQYKKKAIRYRRMQENND